MKRIFLIIMTICMVITTGCGGSSSNKDIDYLNLTLEDLKNINWDMTLDEFKESIGDVEFEEDEEIIRESKYESITIKINDFSFGKFDSSIVKSYEFFECSFKDKALNEIAVMVYPIEGEDESILEICELTFGKAEKEQKNNLFWDYGNSNIALNTQGVFTFIVTQN